jgi:hypothetical protein
VGNSNETRLEMTKEELAALLSGREYGSEMTDEEEARAKASGLMVIFGASDDLTELRGAVSDEVGAFSGATHHVDAKGFIPDWDSVDHDDEDECRAYFAREGKGAEVRAKWSQDGFSWVIETDLPHATFDIMEDDETYCRGVVFAVADLPPTPSPL